MKKLFTRIIVFLMAIVLMFTLLTGCNTPTNSDVTDEPSSTTSYTAGATTDIVTNTTSVNETGTITPTSSNTASSTVSLSNSQSASITPGTSMQTSSGKTTSPSTSTPKPSTPKPSTPKPSTPKPSTPKPSTPKPSTPKPSSAPPTKSPYELEREDKKVILTPNLSGKQAKILILGNSFISSSQIGVALESLAQENNQNLVVEAISEGFADIQSLTHHINDNPGIKRGDYDAIFLCGIFSPNTSYLQNFLNAVKGTKTKIILFPASNESPSDISNARIKYPGAGYCGWLDMIYELWYRESFPKLSLMNDDWVLHTNELGGYAGALMIYNYLYRTSPVTTTTNAFFLNYYSDLIPGSTQAQKTTNLNKMKTVANELVNGNRAYKGTATVSL